MSEPSGAQLARSSRPYHSRFTPIVLIAVAVLLALFLQCLRLLAEHDQLQSLIRLQEPIVQSANATRAKLEKVAGEAVLMADYGNQNAKLLLEEMRKRGLAEVPDAEGYAPREKK